MVEEVLRFKGQIALEAENDCRVREQRHVANLAYDIVKQVMCVADFPSMERLHVQKLRR
jgi:hypothetical protein